MSKNPLPRIASSLLLPLLIWTLIVAGSLILQVQQTRRTSTEIAAIKGRDVFSIVQATRLWVAKHGGVLVDIDQWTPANPYLKLPERDPVTVSGRRLTTLNPAYMTRQLAEVINAETQIAIHITSLKPINPGNQADPWESAALRAFETEGLLEKNEFVEQDGRTLSRYMAPLVTREPCMKCHEQQGYQVGDIRGGISVSQSAEPLLLAMRAQISGQVVTHLVTWLLVVAGMVYFDLYRRRQERQLERSRNLLEKNERMAALGSLVAGVAHEVNTPLGVSVTSASVIEESRHRIGSLLRDELLTQEELEQELATIGEATRLLGQNLRRAAKLIHSFKQIAVDQNTSERRRVDIADLLDEIFVTYHNQLKRLPVKVEIDCPEKMELEIDAGALVQVITNLLQNTLLHAFEGIEREARIQVRVRNEGAWLEILFSDNGKGMTEDMARRAFEPFVTSRRNEGGSGLGLNIVYNLVTQHFGGEVELTSHLDQGTAFHLRLAKG